ncbi:hypothetical protein F3087_34000 [Nocardia colli]|uniref:Uncharacterized protein n=1 Tax=Nocardia colli TaxID=2545717 RepID=A0A5N0E744_9NOCA|nr:hypothetical protein [Nocardia colli]KAA8884239.1 hypothetical protein F3087_34000 [Nocardia colli]
MPPAESSELLVISAAAVLPEAVGELTVQITDGVPELVLTGGPVFPQNLTVLDASGRRIATYVVTPQAVPEVESWIVESDRLRDVSELYDGLHIQIDVSPYIG